MKHISTTALSKKFGMTSRELFAEFEKLDWITSDRNLTVDGFSVGAIYKEIEKDGETIKYIAWPENIELGLSPQNNTLITATKLGKAFDVSALQINNILAELGWSKKGEFNKGWIATEHALALGAIQAEDTKSGIPYIRWPEAITNNKVLMSAIAGFKGNPEINHISADVLAFRERFSANYHAIDGHMTRSKAEALIDNWLYILEITHAYERKLPIDEEVYSSFYIPHGKVYIEYFGCDNDASYGYDKHCNRRKQEKLEIYKKYNFNLIELTYKDVQNLDDVLPKLLLKYGVQTY